MSFYLKLYQVELLLNHKKNMEYLHYLGLL